MATNPRCVRALLPLRLALFLALSVALMGDLFFGAVTAEPLTPDGLLSSLDKSDRVTLVTADGETREITVEEMDRLAKQQHAEAMQMQREKTVDAVNAKARSKARKATGSDENENDAFAFDEGGYKGEEDEEGELEVDLKEDEENAPTRHTKSFAEIRKKNPSFAANIELSKRAFQEIQRHGYARGYEFTGFSEKEVPVAARDAKKPVPKSNNDNKAGGKEKIKREDYKTTLVLRAKRHPTDRAARTGTSAQKREQEPFTVSYEVQVLLDAQDQFSVIAAWELDGDDKHSTRLSIQPSAALLKKQQQAKLAAKKTLLAFFVDVDVATAILAGGVALILAGIVVLYTAQKPGPIARRNSADNWELATDSKKNK